MITIIALVSMASPINVRASHAPINIAPKPVFTRPALAQPAFPVLEDEFEAGGESAIALLLNRVAREGAAPAQTNVRVAADSKPKPKPVLTIEDKIVDVVCTNTDVNGVLALLSASTKANMVLVSPTEARLTLRLRQVRLADAVQHICAVSGLAHLKLPTAYLFGDAARLKAAYPKEWEKAYPTPKAPPTEVKTPVDVPGTSTTQPDTQPVKEPHVTRVVNVSYMDATQLAQTIKELFGSDGVTVVTGPASASPTLGDRDTSGATGVNQGVIQGEGGTKSRTVILRGPQAAVQNAADAIASLDQAGAQVRISVSIHDVNDNALRELGVSWNIGGTTIQESTGNGINFGSFTRTPFNFGATIRALESKDNAKLLASPEVTVLDDERAFVLIGNKLNLPKFDGYDANKIPIYSTSEYRVGIYLQVAASVAADGTITLAVYPQVSTVVKTTEINGGSYPDIATREAQTTLRVKSGDTIVIGGLLRSEELEQLEQVPILSKIPFFGELFKRRKKTRSSSQVVISLTPTLVLPSKS